MSTLFSITACSTERSYTGIVFNTTNNSFIINNGYWNGDGTILSTGAKASIIYVLSIKSNGSMVNSIKILYNFIGSFQGGL